MVNRKKEPTAAELEAQIAKLQKQLEEIQNKDTDLTNIKAGDHFMCCGFEWVCLDPDYQEMGGKEHGGDEGVLAIMAKLWKDNVVFSEANNQNYRKSDIRKLLLKELAPKLEGRVIKHFPDMLMENGKELESVYYADPVFLLSIHEYIRYANRVPYDDYRDSDGDATWWWLRSPSPWTAYDVRFVSTDGSLGDCYATRGGGVAPACIFIR